MVYFLLQHECWIDILSRRLLFSFTIELMEYLRHHAIYPVVGKSSHCILHSRREAVIINKLKIGHSHLTHSNSLSGEDQPTCTSCDVPLIVKHILVDCPDLHDIHQKHFTATSSKNVFGKCRQTTHH